MINLQQCALIVTNALNLSKPEAILKRKLCLHTAGAQQLRMKFMPHIAKQLKHIVSALNVENMFPKLKISKQNKNNLDRINCGVLLHSNATALMVRMNSFL